MPPVSRYRPTVTGLLGPLLLGCCTGCGGFDRGWRPPPIVPPIAAWHLSVDPSIHGLERVYAEAISRRERDDPSCVDLLFDVASQTATYQTCGHACRGNALHRSSLTLLIDAAQAYRRLDPNAGISIRRGEELHQIPFTYHGFVWKPDDFRRWIVVGDYHAKGVSTRHRDSGVGIPLVIESCNRGDRPFLPRKSLFPATLRMAVATDVTGADESRSNYRFEVVDPLRIREVVIDRQAYPLARDLTAQIAYRMRDQSRDYLNRFLYADASGADSQLLMIEPYQPDKIPVLLVHGLLSDAYTWLDVINELRADPDWIQRYQFWIYQYPTGQAFLRSAAQLRAELSRADAHVKAEFGRSPLADMVIVGHSMGGLIGKLQVTFSGDELWRAVANRPLDTIEIQDEYREYLREAFFFEPTPGIGRIVLIGTPHRGSAYASRCVGRLGSMLSRRSPRLDQVYRQMISANPGAFTPELSRRIPSSIDLLDPDSRLLGAIGRLTYAPAVERHSVIGHHQGGLLIPPSDGVVTVASVLQPGATSEVLVRSRHGNLLRSAEAIDELKRILETHWQGIVR